jgi:hypothetical protein
MLNHIDVAIVDAQIQVLGEQSVFNPSSKVLLIKKDVIIHHLVKDKNPLALSSSQLNQSRCSGVS